MGRHWYTAARYAAAVERLAVRAPVFALGADVISRVPRRARRRITRRPSRSLRALPSRRSTSSRLGASGHRGRATSRARVARACAARAGGRAARPSRRAKAAAHRRARAGGSADVVVIRRRRRRARAHRGLSRRRAGAGAPPERAACDARARAARRRPAGRGTRARRRARFRGCLTEPRPTVYVETYGCQMNVSDSELMLGKLAAHGYDAGRSARRRGRHPRQHLRDPRPRRAARDRPAG